MYEIVLEIPLKSSLSMMNPLNAKRNSTRKNSMMMTALTPIPIAEIKKANPMVNRAMRREIAKIVAKSVLGLAP
jgi:hypothetical protein